MGGIFALEDIAESDFETQYTVVQATICSFIRERNAAYVLRKKRTRKQESIRKLNREFRDLIEGIAAFQRLRRDYRLFILLNIGELASNLSRKILPNPIYSDLDKRSAFYDLAGVDFTHFNCRFRVFSRCVLDFCIFTKSNLTCSDLSDSSIFKTSFKHSNLSGVIFNGSKIRQVDFTGADLKNADFTNVTYGTNDKGINDFSNFGTVTLEQMKLAKNVDPEFLQFLGKQEHL